MKTPFSSRLGFVVVMLALLGAAWFAVRYVFFDLHGMIDFPTALAFLAGILILLAGLADFRKLPKNAFAGYVLGFVVAALFAGESMDPGGGATSNFWLIWSGVFALLCLRGVIATVIARTIRSR